MMKFSIGYQLPDELDSTPDICRDFAGRVEDVYFSWAQEPSGRSPLCQSPARLEEVRRVQLAELQQIRAMGCTLTLLLNANCYGGGAVSAGLRQHALHLVGWLREQTDLSTVTTTSPFLAEAIHAHFGKEVAVRASVNMRIGSTAAMEQLTYCFDGFYLKKECNRNLEQIAQLRRWCDDHGKTLHLLANSGCLTDCAFQTFHDNLVAHEAELTTQENAPQTEPALCRGYLRRLPTADALTRVLQANWIRPEELPLYEPYFSQVKLATRMHSRPRMVVAAYARQRFCGNLLDLTEPSYSGLFRGTVLDNTRMDPDWARHATTCTHRCETCGYCRRVADALTVHCRP